MPEIVKSVFVQASDNHTLWIIEDAIWKNPDVWVLTEKYIGNDLQPMQEQDTAQQEVRGGVTVHSHRVSASTLKRMSETWC